MSLPTYNDPKQMWQDKRRYGALDGDNASRCIRCGGRFDGGTSNVCPYCLNKELTNPKQPDRLLK